MIENTFRSSVIVVTGGSQGIGLCLVHRFAQAGALVAFCDVNRTAGQYWEQKLKNAGLDVFFVQADLAREAQVRRFARAVLKKYGRIDVLINNAGITSFGKPFLKRPTREWERILAVNLTSYFLCSQLFAQALIRSRGSIIQIASSRALMSEPETDPYSASKGGIVALTHSLAITLGPRGVRVNCVSPGWIDTSSWKRKPTKPRLRPIDHRQHPVGRVGEPDDIAQACLFLASRQSAGFITGHNLVVDGGMTRKMIYV